MKKTIKSLLIMATSTLIAGCSSQSIDKQVDELYNRMSQEERIAQLRGMYISDLFAEDGSLDTLKCRQLIPNGIGHFSQFASQESLSPNEIRDKVAVVQEWLVNNTPNGIPALFHEEVLTGVNTRDATVYPQQIGQACSFNTQLAELKTLQTGRCLRRIGGMLSLSPMVDVVRTPSFNRLEESYGEDAYLSAAMGTAFVRGLQQGGLREGVGACSKHFLGYGGGGNAQEKELMEEILLPHEAMIREAGSKVVMTGYHAVHGTNCVANEELQQGILRDYLHFDGMMVSDYGAVDQVPGQPDAVHLAAAAINAGNDVDFPKGDSYAHLQEAIDKGLVSQETFERAVKCVLRYKAMVGLLDKDPKLYEGGNIEYDTKEERQTAYDIATQSVVLLKNDGILPLNKPQRIALTGPNANSMWAMLGDYTFQSMSYFWKLRIEDDMHPHIVGLREGMNSRLPEGSTLSYSRGCDWTENVETIVEDGGDERASYMRSVLNRKVDSGETANLEEALKIANESDVIVAAVGENVMLSGENRDRGSLRLPGSQEQFVERLIATGKPVVLVVFGGRAQVISSIADRCAAVIQAWYPGEEGGNAVADILYGNVSPSGKLSVSYPNVELNEPICYNYSDKHNPRIAWPFGFGLSYTTFEYSALQVDAEAKTNDESISISFAVKNTGKIAADEIAQIYLSPTSADQHIRPIQLHGFGRVHLNPGEERTLHFTMSPQQFGYYADHQWHVAPGKYTIKIGASCEDIRLSSDITLTGDTYTLPLRTNYFTTMQDM